jgi:hypothetical protein
MRHTTLFSRNTIRCGNIALFHLFIGSAWAPPKALWWNQANRRLFRDAWEEEPLATFGTANHDPSGHGFRAARQLVGNTRVTDL